jgi:predicted CopG family antitoxin
LSIQTRYTSIRIASEVYNSLLHTKKILEQAYSKKFSFSDVIQLLNALSTDAIQKISSTRRDLDRMIEGKIASGVRTRSD